MSNLPLIGAAVGLAWAVLDFFVLMPLIERPLRRGAEALQGEERDRMVRRLRLIRSLFVWQFAVFPIVGFLVGQALSP